MWSIGCILAQLLLRSANKDENNIEESQKYYKFLAGDSCFPLSPGAAEQAAEESNGVVKLSSQDQLLMILNLIGQQTTEDLSFLTDINAIDYVNKVQKGANK